jgi:hypothetical protein
MGRSQSDPFSEIIFTEDYRSRLAKGCDDGCFFRWFGANQDL